MHTRAVLCFWITLLVMAVLATSSPVPEPEPAPIDSTLAAVIASNMNLGCQHGCAGASSAQQLSTNAAPHSAASPLSVFASLAFVGSVLGAI